MPRDRGLDSYLAIGGGRLMLVELVDEACFSEPAADGDELIFSGQSEIKPLYLLSDRFRICIPTELGEHFLNQPLIIVRHCHSSLSAAFTANC